MLQAELHGKLSTRSYNSDITRSEDTLTSAVLGAVQYLPREAVLRPFLTCAFPNVTWSEAECRDARFDFWPTFDDQTEPDLVLTVGRCVIVVEAKYGAAFGKKQLEREWKGGLKDAQSKGCTDVQLLTITKDLGGEPPDVTSFRELLDLGPRVAHLTWQRIARVLNGAEVRTPESKALLADVLDVMSRRGVRHVYKGIENEDWWAVCAAQRIARKRVYPEIAALGRQLQESLHPDGVGWGVSEDKVVHYHSFALSSPASWARSYLQLPLWPDSWPKYDRGRWWATFQILFDFLNAEVTVGYLTRPRNVADARATWVPAAAALLKAARTLPEDYQLTTTHGNYARVTDSQQPSMWTEAALTEQLTRPACHLVLERRLDLQDFGGAAHARALILETVAAIKERPIWVTTPSGQALASAPTEAAAQVSDDGVLAEVESAMDQTTESLVAADASIRPPESTRYGIPADDDLPIDTQG